MSKFCCTRVTSLSGSMPLRRNPASSSNSLPKPQLPTVLPAKSSTEVMPESAQDTCSVALRSKIWAMFTTSAPSSRGTSARGTHDTAKSAPPESSTGIGTISTPPSRMVTSRHRSS